MKSTFRVLFFLKRDKQKKDGCTPLMCRITVDGKESRFSMKMDIDSESWDLKANKAFGQAKEVQEINSLVENTKASLYHIFIFACFTGLAYIDVQKLRKEHIRESFDGKLWIMTKRQKTNTNTNVPLLDIPKGILKKYEGTLPNEKLLPVPSNQKLNSYLKEIADVCGIKKNFTFHMARHTFSTTITLSKELLLNPSQRCLAIQIFERPKYMHASPMKK